MKKLERKNRDDQDFLYKLVGLGGCFDHLHGGHKELLRTAFKLGQKVAIGLTTEELQQTKECKTAIESYKVREQNLRNYIENQLGINNEYCSVIPLKDPFGPAITEAELEAHVSSVETYQGALMINEKRIQNGLKPLVLIIIPLVLNDAGKKISSTELRKRLEKR
jgi:pantetheine-phosphate adenylyltransferase